MWRSLEARHASCTCSCAAGRIGPFMHITPTSSPACPAAPSNRLDSKLDLGGALRRTRCKGCLAAGGAALRLRMRGGRRAEAAGTLPSRAAKGADASRAVSGLRIARLTCCQPGLCQPRPREAFLGIALLQASLWQSPMVHVFQSISRRSTLSGACMMTSRHASLPDCSALTLQLLNASYLPCMF